LLAHSTVDALYCACRFRPRHPHQVYDIILSHLGADQRSLAVDVATGSGQAAVQLAEDFKQVISQAGQDHSVTVDVKVRL
jgi:hypothetical protein